jgi:lipopolysaccharide export system protein LptA
MGHYQSEASALSVGFLCPLAMASGGLALLLAMAPGAQAEAVTPVAGVVSIESDLQRADNLTGIVTASGNVRIVYPDRRVVATARQAQYFSREGRVVLSGDVDVIQTEGPSIQADRITYLVEEQRLMALPPEGGQVLSRFPIAPLSTPSVDPNTP